MKLKIYNKKIIYLLMYLLLGINIWLLYLFREQLCLIIILSILCFLEFIGLILISIKKNIKNKKISREKISNNYNRLKIFIRDSKDLELDETRYTKKILYKNKNILETFDFQIFTPVFNKKRGRRISDYQEVIRYLKNVTKK